MVFALPSYWMTDALNKTENVKSFHYVVGGFSNEQAFWPEMHISFWDSFSQAVNHVSILIDSKREDISPIYSKMQCIDIT